MAAETVGTMMIVDHIAEMAIVTAMNKTEVAEAVRAVGQLKVLFPIISPFFSTIFPHFPPFAIFLSSFPPFFQFFDVILKSPLTVCKFQNLTATQIFREINFCRYGAFKNCQFRHFCILRILFLRNLTNFVMSGIA